MVALQLCAHYAGSLGNVTAAGGWLSRSYGSPHVDAICRTAHGEVLLAMGRWAEAESELLSALQKMSQRAEPLVRTQALANLAELRLLQGRMQETSRLPDGVEGHIACAFVCASTYAAHGELRDHSCPRATGTRPRAGGAGQEH
jgi:hypothetical protein